MEWTQRGTDRLLVINKAAESLALRDLATTLKPGRYIEIHEGWPLDVQADGSIHQWNVPAQTAVPVLDNHMMLDTTPTVADA
jgi:hypothetical protein